MENQELKSSSQTHVKEIDLFELLQKSWNIAVKFISQLLYRFIRFIIFSLRNIHWLILSVALGIGFGYWQFTHTGKIYEASSVLYLPHGNALVCIQTLENIDVLLKSQQYQKVTEGTNIDTVLISNILSIDYAYGVIVEGDYPNYFVKNFDYNKKGAKLATDYLQITVRCKQSFSEESIQTILRELLIKNEYLALTTKNYLEQQQELLLLLEKEVVKAQQAADIEIAQREQPKATTNIILSMGVDTTTLVRPIKLQRERLDLIYKLKLFKKGLFIFVTDFYFTKVLNSTVYYTVRWTLVFVLIMYGVLFYIKRKRYIKLFIQKVEKRAL